MTYFFHFLQLQKEQTETTNKNSIGTCEKTILKPQSHILPLKKCSVSSVAPTLNASDVVCDLSLMRLGKQLTKSEKVVISRNSFVFFESKYFKVIKAMSSNA